MRSLILPLVILGLPIAEIAGFVIVGREVGLLMTLLLVFLSGVVGIALLRVQGFEVFRRVQESARAGRDPGREVLEGALVFVAAILLIVPGFISDVMGLILFLPAIRRAVATFLQTRMSIVTAGTGFYRSGPGGREERTGPRVIDLNEDEFSREKKDDDGSSPTNRFSR